MMLVYMGIYQVKLGVCDLHHNNSEQNYTAANLSYFTDEGQDLWFSLNGIMH